MLLTLLDWSTKQPLAVVKTFIGGYLSVVSSKCSEPSARACLKDWRYRNYVFSGICI